MVVKDTQLAVDIDNVSFQYENADRKILSHISLKIPMGQRFGLFGPNGAGKSTLMHLMTGIRNFSQGKITIFGESILDGSFKRHIGYVPQDFSFYEELTPLENLAFFGSWSGMSNSQIKSRSEYLLSVLGLSDVVNKKIAHFSGGMKRRVNLAIGVLHQPKLLILDEPTVGVDVQSRTAMMDFLHKENELGTTILYTSHQLNEAENFCQYIALIDQGEIIAQDTLDILLKEESCSSLEELFIKRTGRQYRN